MKMKINGLEFIPMRIQSSKKDFLLYLLSEYDYPIGEIVLGHDVFIGGREQ